MATDRTATAVGTVSALVLGYAAARQQGQNKLNDAASSSG